MNDLNLTVLAKPLGRAMPGSIKAYAQGKLLWECENPSDLCLAIRVSAAPPLDPTGHRCLQSRDGSHHNLTAFF